MHRHQVCRSGDVLLEDPGRLATARGASTADAACNHRVRLVGGHRQLIRRLVGRHVVAREPAGRARRLRRHEGAVFELLPADRPPARAARSGSARIRHGDFEPLAGSERRRQRDSKLAIALVEGRDARSGRGDFRGAKPDQVERERAGRRRGSASDHRGTGQAVGADLVVQRERVVLDQDAGITALRDVRVGPHASADW